MLILIESPNTPIVLLNYYAWKSRLGLSVPLRPKFIASIGALTSEQTKLSVPFIDELGIRSGFRHLPAESTVDRPSVFVIASMTGQCVSDGPANAPATHADRDRPSD